MHKITNLGIWLHSHFKSDRKAHCPPALLAGGHSNESARRPAGAPLLSYFDICDASSETNEDNTFGIPKKSPHSADFFMRKIPFPQ